MKFIKLLLPMLCGLCFFCYSTVGGALTVAADGDSDISVILTPQQTLALFGSSFDGFYYDSGYQQFFNLHFDYIGLSTDLVPRTQGAGANAKMFFNTTGQQQPLTSSQMNCRTCLVYRAQHQEATSNNGSNSRPNLEIPLNISIPSAFGYAQKIYYGQSQASYQSRLSQCSVLGNGISQTFYNANSGSPLYYQSLCKTPVVPSNDASELTDNDYLQVGLFQITLPAQENRFDISQIDLRINKMKWTYQYGLDDGGSLSNGLWCTLVFIECPIIGGYVPPVTTAPVTQTGETVTAYTGATVSIPPQQTVNLSDIESGVATMVQEQWDTNYLLRLQIDQLNTIIQQLNSIYAKMVEEGQIAIDLVPADPARRFNTDILDQVQNASTSYTVAQLPQDYAGNGSAGIGAFIARVVGVDPVFMTIGIFSIGFAIFCWFIFRGRGGV